MRFNGMALKLEDRLLFSGSQVAFKKRQQAPLSEEERELKYVNERKLQEGISLLRKLRTSALEEQDAGTRQNALEEARHLSAQMAEVIISQAASDKPFQIEPSFLETLSLMRGRYKNQDAGSGHAIPPQFPITNLFHAADDLLARIEEKVHSLYAPKHRLTPEEMKYVLHEFLVGTNDLTVNAIGKFFELDTKVGGILSGGCVYAEIVRIIIDKYADPSLRVYPFAIAVNKENGKAVLETSSSDHTTKTVIIVDDFIDTGATVIPALWAAGEYFPKATIYSSQGTDQAGGFEKRRVEKHTNYLGALFQDFADFSEDGKKSAALAIFRQAEEYAKRNRVSLQRGWHLCRERLEEYG